MYISTIFFLRYFGAGRDVSQNGFFISSRLKPLVAILNVAKSVHENMPKGRRCTVVIKTKSLEVMLGLCRLRRQLQSVIFTEAGSPWQSCGTPNNSGTGNAEL